MSTEERKADKIHFRENLRKRVLIQIPLYGLVSGFGLLEISAIHHFSYKLYRFANFPRSLCSFFQRFIVNSTRRAREKNNFCTIDACRLSHDDEKAVRKIKWAKRIKHLQQNDETSIYLKTSRETEQRARFGRSSADCAIKFDNLVRKLSKKKSSSKKIFFWKYWKKKTGTANKTMIENCVNWER